MKKTDTKAADPDTTKCKPSAPTGLKVVKKRKHTSICFNPTAMQRIILILLLFLPMLLFSRYILQTGSSLKFVAKLDMKAMITKAIEKGADLRAIKHAYDNRNLTAKSLTQIFSDMKDFYAETVPLSVILEDIRTDKYVLDVTTGPDTQVIDSIIEQHLAVNPFDALEDAQKDYFENIRLKLSSNYS